MMAMDPLTVGAQAQGRGRADRRVFFFFSIDGIKRRGRRVRKSRWIEPHRLLKL